MLLPGVACVNPHGRALAEAKEKVGGNPERGAQLVRRTSCGACHLIAGIEGARGHAAPSLEHLSTRLTIAGGLPNTPENVMRWIEQPRSIKPDTRMPTFGFSHEDARDIATYLWAQP